MPFHEVSRMVSKLEFVVLGRRRERTFGCCAVASGWRRRRVTSGWRGMRNGPCRAGGEVASAASLALPQRAWRRGRRSRGAGAASGVGRPQDPGAPSAGGGGDGACALDHHRHPAPAWRARGSPWRRAGRLDALRAAAAQRPLADGPQGPCRHGRRPAAASAHRARRSFALRPGAEGLHGPAHRQRPRGAGRGLPPLWAAGGDHHRQWRALGQRPRPAFTRSASS